MCQERRSAQRAAGRCWTGGGSRQCYRVAKQDDATTEYGPDSVQFSAIFTVS